MRREIVSFTDEDLAVLKQYLAIRKLPGGKGDLLQIDDRMIEYVIARMEAAEACINPANCYAIDYEVWRKVAGKDA